MLAAKGACAWDAWDAPCSRLAVQLPQRQRRRVPGRSSGAISHRPQRPKLLPVLADVAKEWSPRSQANQHGGFAFGMKCTYVYREEDPEHIPLYASMPFFLPRAMETCIATFVRLALLAWSYRTGVYVTQGSWRTTYSELEDFGRRVQTLPNQTTVRRKTHSTIMDVRRNIIGLLERRIMEQKKHL